MAFGANAVKLLVDSQRPRLNNEARENKALGQILDGIRQNQTNLCKFIYFSAKFLDEYAVSKNEQRYIK